MFSRITIVVGGVVSGVMAYIIVSLFTEDAMSVLELLIRVPPVDRGIISGRVPLFGQPPIE